MIPLLSCYYLPNIHYIKQIINSSEIILEKFEFFKKQTYSTRCYIHSPNGKQMLNIPIIHSKNNSGKQIISNIKIDYSENWQKQHIKSLETAYRSSPYYEFYEHKIIPFYKQKWENLFDFNVELLKLILDIINYNIKIDFTQEYKKEYKGSFLDLRGSFNAKDPIIYDSNSKKYFQIFSEKNGFIENLSIIDLIFIKGNNTLDFLKN